MRCTPSRPGRPSSPRRRPDASPWDCADCLLRASLRSCSAGCGHSGRRSCPAPPAAEASRCFPHVGTLGLHGRHPRPRAEHDSSPRRGRVDARYRYYVLSDLAMPDAEFDALLRELEAIEGEFPVLLTADSPTQQVGSPLDEAFPPFEHLEAMQSLDNVFGEDDLRAWAERVARGLPAGRRGALGVRAEDRRHRHQLRLPQRRAGRRRHPRHRRGRRDGHPAAAHARRRAVPPRRRRPAGRRRDPRRGVLPGREVQPDERGAHRAGRAGVHEPAQRRLRRPAPEGPRQGAGAPAGDVGPRPRPRRGPRRSPPTRSSSTGPRPPGCRCRTQSTDRRHASTRCGRSSRTSPSAGTPSGSRSTAS